MFHLASSAATQGGVSERAGREGTRGMIHTSTWERLTKFSLRTHERSRKADPRNTDLRTDLASCASASATVVRRNVANAPNYSACSRTCPSSVQPSTVAPARLAAQHYRRVSYHRTYRAITAKRRMWCQMRRSRTVDGACPFVGGTCDEVDPAWMDNWTPYGAGPRQMLKHCHGCVHSGARETPRVAH